MPSYSEDEIDQIMRDFDADGNGQISYQEFISLVQNLAQQEDTRGVRKAFKMFDTDGDGSITPLEMKKTFTKLGLKLSDGQIYALVAEADMDGDGCIDYKEFMTLVADTDLVKTSNKRKNSRKK